MERNYHIMLDKQGHYSVGVPCEMRQSYNWQVSKSVYRVFDESKPYRIRFLEPYYPGSKNLEEGEIIDKVVKLLGNGLRGMKVSIPRKFGELGKHVRCTCKLGELVIEHVPEQSFENITTEQ